MLPSRKRKNSNKEKMYFVPPTFHFFLMLVTARGHSNLSGPGIFKLLGRKQKKDLDSLKLVEITNA